MPPWGLSEEPLPAPRQRDSDVSRHPELAGADGASPCCAHGGCLHGPFICSSLQGLSLVAHRWGTVHTGLRQPAPATRHG